MNTEPLCSPCAARMRQARAIGHSVRTIGILAGIAWLLVASGYALLWDSVADETTRVLRPHDARFASITGPCGPFDDPEVRRCEAAVRDGVEREHRRSFLSIAGSGAACAAVIVLGTMLVRARRYGIPRNAQYDGHGGYRTSAEGERVCSRCGAALPEEDT